LGAPSAGRRGSHQSREPWCRSSSVHDPGPLRQALFPRSFAAAGKQATLQPGEYSPAETLFPRVQACAVVRTASCRASRRHREPGSDARRPGDPRVVTGTPVRAARVNTSRAAPASARSPPAATR
jgi:hypothetical protein